MELRELQTIYRQPILEIAARRNVQGQVRIFGSVARGDNTILSDVDFLVSLKPNASLLDLSGFRIDLEELLGCHVDVVLEKSLHWVIKEQVLQEAVAL